MRTGRRGSTSTVSSSPTARTATTPPSPRSATKKPWAASRRPFAASSTPALPGSDPERGLTPAVRLRQQPAQDEGEDAAVAEVLPLDGRVEAEPRAELLLVGAHRHL